MNSSPEAMVTSRLPQCSQRKIAAMRVKRAPHDRHFNAAGTSVISSVEPSRSVPSTTRDQQWRSVSGTIWRSWPSSILTRPTGRPAALSRTVAAMERDMDSSCNVHPQRVRTRRA